MLNEVNRKWQSLKYLWTISPIVMFNKIVKKSIASIYRHEFGYIILRPVFTKNKYRDNKGTECIVIKTPESLKAWEEKISELIPVDQLRKHLAAEKGNCVIFATRPNSSVSGREVVAYRMVQRGIFYDDWGIRGELSLDTLFINHTEVLPKYRGERIYRMLEDATQDYCRQNRINKWIAVVVGHNQPILKAFFRCKGGKIIGKIELFSLFGGLYKRVTSWDEVKKLIDNS